MPGAGATSVSVSGGWFSACEAGAAGAAGRAPMPTAELAALQLLESWEAGEQTWLANEFAGSW